MSETPRSDKAWNTFVASHVQRAHNMLDKAKELEIELTVIKSQFTEYVKAEDAWRDNALMDNVDDLRLAAAKLRTQAIKTLDL